MRYYIVHYVYGFYTGRIFQKLIVFNDEIIESTLRKYFIKEKGFAILPSGGGQRDTKINVKALSFFGNSL